MKNLKKQSSLKNWNLIVECTGDLNMNGGNPCGRSRKIKKYNIVQRNLFVIDSYVNIYGFICPYCKCFTYIEEENIPQEIIQRLNSRIF